MSCQNLKFDLTLSQKRINRATHIFSIVVIRRILCFSLYLLGATRTSIAKLIEMPTEFVPVTVPRIISTGISLKFLLKAILTRFSIKLSLHLSFIILTFIMFVKLFFSYKFYRISFAG